MTGELAIELRCKAANLDDARARLESQGRRWFGDAWGRHCKYDVVITNVKTRAVDLWFDVTGIAGREDHVKRATARPGPGAIGCCPTCGRE